MDKKTIYILISTLLGVALLLTLGLILTMFTSYHE